MGRLAPVMLLLSLLLGASAQPGAIIRGTVYDFDFKPVAAVVQVNTTPAQVAVGPNGSYSLSVAPGVYLISASSRASETASEVLNVKEAGAYTLDFVLLPDPTGVGDFFEGLDGELQYFDLPSSGGLPLASAVLLLLAGVAAGVFFLRRSSQQAVQGGPTIPAEVQPRGPAGFASEAGSSVTEEPHEKPGQQAQSAELLPLADEAEVLSQIDKDGGLITQKELRRRLPAWSESRVSLVLSSLEQQGRIKKIKQGRGNIIRKSGAA